MPTRSYFLAGWPVGINQNDSRGRFPNDSKNDCLPACLSAVDAYLRGWTAGQAVAPDAIRDWGYGDGHTGYTTPGVLVPWLWQRGIPAQTLADFPVREARLTVEAAVQQGRPVLALTWEGAYYHWTPLIGFDQGTITRHQTIGGYAETLTWDRWLDLYAGYLVVVGVARGQV